MSHNLVRLPSIMDLHQPIAPYHPSFSDNNNTWTQHAPPLTQPLGTAPDSATFYPLQLVLLVETPLKAPRSMADNFRFVLVPIARLQRRKKSASHEVKDRAIGTKNQATKGALISDPTVSFPIRDPSVPEGLIPAEELLLLKTSVYPTICTKRYSASALDPTKSNLMVYEYAVGAHWVIWDHDTGYVHLTGLWRAALQERALQKSPNGSIQVKANAKADIVKLLELTPKALHPYIKRVRGGFLKIQGTWVPFHLCRRLALRFCYYIRFQLVPIFGTEFPSECLHPSDSGFGELRFDDSASSIILPQISPRLLIDERESSKFQRYSVDQGSPFNPLQSSICAVSDRPQWPQYSLFVFKTPGFTMRNPEFHELKPEPFFGNHPRTTNSKVDKGLALSNHKTHTCDRSADFGPSLKSTVTGNSAMTYSDMVDVVNASKCLQLLSQRASTSLESPITRDPVHLEKMRIDNLLS